MRHWALLVGALGVATLGHAQSKARLDAIWDAADTRMNRQLDVWFDDGEFPAVVQLLRIQAQLFPGDYEVSTNLGWMLENIERYPEAESEYKRYLRENPKDPDAPLPLANFYFMAARIRRQAIPGVAQKDLYARIPPLLEPALARKPHANVFRVLAHSYERLGRLSDSRRVWRRYIALAPKDLTAKNNLARVERKIKEAGGKAKE